MRDARALVVMVLATAAIGWAVPAAAQTSFSGAGEHSELDCDGGAVTVEGASNMLTIRGACTSLTVSGASNLITIDLAAKASIRVEGADNQIRWIAPGTAKPRVSVAGAGNQIARRR